jgi:hypothetical protein
LWFLSKEKNEEINLSTRDWEFRREVCELEISSLYLSKMFPPRFGAPSMVGRNTRINAQVTQKGTQEMPTIMDVDEIHTPEYEPHNTQVKEEGNPSQEVGKLEEDKERT